MLFILCVALQSPAAGVGVVGSVMVCPVCCLILS